MRWMNGRVMKREVRKDDRGTSFSLKEWMDIDWNDGLTLMATQAIFIQGLWWMKVWKSDMGRGLWAPVKE